MSRYTTHTVEAELEVLAQGGEDPDDTRYVYPTVAVTFRYLPGNPATPPAYAHGGLPPDPAEVEFVSARAVDAAGLIRDWDVLGAEWLATDRGYEIAENKAAEDNEYDDR